MVRSLIVCVGIACAGAAVAAPKGATVAAPKAGRVAAPRVGAQAQLKAAAAQYSNGNYQRALELIERGLAVAPQDLGLLGLKGSVLLDLRDYLGALAAYEAYLKAGPTGQNQRQAQNIVKKLEAVKSTFLEITLANGPADIYLGSKTLGLFCQAAPSCNQAVLPDQYKVIAERPGFARWTGDVTVESGKTTKLAVTLVERPSLLTVRAEPAEARVTVDGAPHDAPAEVPAGKRWVVASLPGHAEERRLVEARQGKPIEVAIALAPLVPIRIQPPGAELRLDDRSVAIEDGHIAIPRGARILVARAPGYQDHRIELPAERGAEYQLAIELERAVVAKAPEPAAVAAVVESPPSPGLFSFKRRLALAVGGVGLAAASAGVVLGLRAGNVEDGAGTLEAHQLRQRRELQSHLAYGAAGLAVGIALGLWLDGAPGQRTSIMARVGPVSGIDLAVKF
jgi:tetratricopeptide (TPR) repeat protein